MNAPVTPSLSNGLPVDGDRADARQSLFPAVKKMRWGEHVIHGLLVLCASISVLTTISIVMTLVIESSRFFRHVSIVEFLTGTKWSPLLEPQHFGVLPLVCGTLWIAFGSGLIALPVGLLTAIYLSEYASPFFRQVLKPVLEILAGIPSVVYGYLAIVLLSPVVRRIFPSAEVFNVLNASIAVGIMIVPTVISLSEDVLRSVPRSLREASYALGADKFQTITRVIVPAAASGIAASFILAISRAIGETMAVTLAAGARPRITLNPLHSVQTMTAYIVEKSKGETPAGTLEYQTIFAVCMTLFLMTLLMNILSQWILARLRQKYD